jgi:phosphoribosylamine---glycine ligase
MKQAVTHEKVLLVGRWGKTHALAKAIVKNPQKKLYSFMDKPNAGIVNTAHEYRLGDLTDPEEILAYAKEKNVDFVVIVPHMTLTQGLADRLLQEGIPFIGPTKKCSELETDKGFLRELLKECGLDVSPKYAIFYDAETTIDHIKNYEGDFAVKPAGVTDGDGVKVIGIQLKDKADAIGYVNDIFAKNMGGLPSVLIEEKLTGEEFTIQAFADGKTLHVMPATRDYKLLNDGDTGLNTPGMGSISFADHKLPFLSAQDMELCIRIMGKAIRHLASEYNEHYSGILSGQFILTPKGPKVIEFNVRPGDSEILNIIPILKTDFMSICHAIYYQGLSEVEIEYEKKATVCKYVVKKGFPYPKGKMHMEIDEKGIEAGGGHLFYSCFKTDENIYKPSPRGVAVTATGEMLDMAWEACENMIEKYIKGQDIWHRRDIGTAKLLNR